MDRPVVLHMVEDMEVGGIQRIVQALALGLDKGRFRPVVWALSRGGDAYDAVKAAGVEAHVLGLGPAEYKSISGAVRLARGIRALGPVIAHTHGYPAGVLGRVSARLARVPAIINHLQNVYPEWPRRHLLMERTLGAFTFKVICCSEAVRRFAVDAEGIPARKTAVVYNCSEPFTAHVARAGRRGSLGVPEGAPLVGTVASLREHKGHIYLLSAAARLKKKFPGLTLLFLGEGPIRASLEAEVGRLGLSGSVIMPGDVSDVRPYLAAMDLYVMPSLKEGLGLAAVEAMSAGLAVVASGVDGLTEVVADGKTGVLVPPGDDGALERAIAGLLEDEGLRRAMGEAGRQRHAELFTSEAMVQAVEHIYKEALGGRA